MYWLDQPLRAMSNESYYKGLSMSLVLPILLLLFSLMLMVFRLSLLIICVHIVDALVAHDVSTNVDNNYEDELNLHSIFNDMKFAFDK